MIKRLLKDSFGPPSPVTWSARLLLLALFNSVVILPTAFVVFVVLR